MMDKIVEQGLLYDCYGPLLTPHQQAVYRDAVYEDLSLQEIAEQQGISRQGVHDLLKRSTDQMQAYEQQLHLVRRTMVIREEAERLKSLAGESGTPDLQEILGAANRILEELP